MASPSSTMAMASSSLLIALLLFSSLMQSSQAVRFELKEEECFTEFVEYDGDTIHISYVVVQDDRSWNGYKHDGARVLVTIDGPNNFRQIIHEKSYGNYQVTARHRGDYKLCFKSASTHRYSESLTVDFNSYIGHISSEGEKLQEGHVDPLMRQVKRLREAIESVYFEQHWFDALTERQEKFNDKFSGRLVLRAFAAAVSLIGASVLQVYFLQRLFYRKLSQTRV